MGTVRRNAAGGRRNQPSSNTISSIPSGGSAALLYTHLLKWQSQPTLRSRSWELTIKEQRRRLRRHLGQNPSLKSKFAQAQDDAYGDAILETARQTGLVEESFPTNCPFSDEQTLDDSYWPQ